MIWLADKWCICWIDERSVESGSPPVFGNNEGCEAIGETNRGNQPGKPNRDFGKPIKKILDELSRTHPAFAKWFYDRRRETVRAEISLPKHPTWSQQNMSFTKTNYVALLAACLFALSACNDANAQKVPFTVFGKGGGDGFSVAGIPSPFGAKGVSYPVGRYRSENGFAISQSFDGVGAGEFLGTFTFVNRRGHKLVTTFGDTSNGASQIGTYTAIPVGPDLVRILFIAEFNPVAGESTGRFRNVTEGSLLMFALTEPIPPVFDDLGFSVPFEFNWFGSGYLKYGNCDD